MKRLIKMALVATAMLTTVSTSVLIASDSEPYNTLNSVDGLQSNLSNYFIAVGKTYSMNVIKEGKHDLHYVWGTIRGKIVFVYCTKSNTVTLGKDDVIIKQFKANSAKSVAFYKEALK